MTELFYTNYAGKSMETCSMDDKKKEHYPYEIKYDFNSKGFRDREWPEDIENKNWIIGDSYTKGLGQPIEHTWPRMLENLSQQQYIVVAEDGCSNDRMCERIKYIAENYKPSSMIVMWSFFARRFEQGKNVHITNRYPSHDDDLQNFMQNFHTANKVFPGLVNLVIPDAFINDTGHTYSADELVYLLTKQNIDKHIIVADRKDFARDEFHFGLLTCEGIAKKTFDLIGNI
jgi:hypothetical protein